DALVDAGAGAGINRGWSLRIDCDREDIGVFVHAAIEHVPALSAVSGLVGQTPGSGVDHVRVLRVNCERLNVMDVVRRDAGKFLAAIIATVNAIERAGDDHIRIRRGDGQRTNRFPFHILQRRPAAATVFGAEQFAVLTVDAPGGNVDDAESAGRKTDGAKTEPAVSATV